MQNSPFLGMPYFIYRWFMKLAHRHNWHHTVTSRLDNGDTHIRCNWCGLTEIRRYEMFAGMKIIADPACPRDTVIITNLKVPQDPGGY